MLKSSPNQSFNSENFFLAKPFTLEGPLNNGFSKVKDRHHKKPGKFDHAPHRLNAVIGRKHQHNN